MKKLKRLILTNAAVSLLRRRSKRQKCETGTVSSLDKKVIGVEEMPIPEGPKDNEPVTEEEWLECLDIEEYVKRIPSGKIEMVTGEDIYIDGSGHKFSREQYETVHKCDPEVVWAAVKARRAQTGKKDNVFVI